MRISTLLPAIAFSVAVHLTTTHAKYTHAPCPILGAAFPHPQDLPNSKTFQDGLRAFDVALNDGISNDSMPYYGLTNFQNTTFSVGIFSVFQPDALLHEFHYTSAFTANSSVGSTSAGSDSVYRIGSISKLLTVFVFVVRRGLADFEAPITRFIPELAIASEDLDGKNGILTDWNDVTVRDLASHLSGSNPNYGQNDNPELEGAPQLSKEQMFSCDLANAQGDFCTGAQYLQGWLKLPAVLAPGYTIGYNNVAFFLLKIALERMTGLPFETLFEQTLVQALGLNGTSYKWSSARNARGIIPGGNDTLPLWESDLGSVDPAGSYFSTTNDLAKLGRAILNSTYISKSTTRRWMKPAAMTTADHGTIAIGAPWEITRVRRGSKVYDLYTKAGDLDAYRSIFYLSPDYGVGFSILTAELTGPDRTFYKTHPRNSIPDLIGETILPALDMAAAEEALARFGGQYTHGNSSMTLTIDQHAGLKVSNFTIGGVDQLQQAIPGPGPYSGPQPEPHADLRLFPNELYTSGSKVGFIGSMLPIPSFVDPGIGSLDCYGWAALGGVTYGNVPQYSFVFDINESGKAVKVEAKGFRMTLEKVEP